MASSVFIRGDRGMGSIGIVGLLLPAVLAAGVGGFALQRSVADDRPVGAELPANRHAAPVYDCPEEPTVADVHNGDRVFAIGVHEDLDGWLLIRNPIDPTVQWWIEARYVTTDDATSELPELGCDDPVPEPDDDELAAAPDGSTTTSTEPDEDEEEDEDAEDADGEESTTTTGDVDVTTTTARQQSSTTTTGQQPTTTTRPKATTTTRPKSTTTTKPKPTTTTTTAPDTSGPSLSLSQSHKDIWETYPSSCSGKAKQATISASASDPSGVKSVIATWSVGNFNESRDLTTGPKTFGPYNYGTVPSSGQAVTITVKAVDNKNNSTTKTMTITVHSVDECFG